MKDAVPILDSELDSYVLRFRFDVGYEVVYPTRNQFAEGNQILVLIRWLPLRKNPE